MDLFTIEIQNEFDLIAIVSVVLFFALGMICGALIHGGNSQ